MNKIIIVGIGNILLKDDGVGVHAVHELLSRSLPEDVECIDAGTCIFELLPVFCSSDTLLIIDSLKGGHQPGTIYRLTPEELGGHITERSSLHDVQVLDIMKQAQLLGHSPDVVILGVEPLEITYDMEMSPLFRDLMPTLIEQVFEFINDKRVACHA